MKVCLIGFDNRKRFPIEDISNLYICEAMLTICGISEVKDLPNGKRIFTVERMPDNVPVANIYWELDNSEIKFNLKGGELS